MVELSPDEKSIIEDHSLSDLVHDLCGLLQEAENIYASRLILNDGSVDSLDKLYQNAISKLLYALQGEDAAFNLRSRSADHNVASDLADLFKRLQRAPFYYEHYRPLTQLVVNKAADTDIWTAGLEGCITGYESLYLKARLIQSNISLWNLLVNEDADNPMSPEKERVVERFEEWNYMGTEKLADAKKRKMFQNAQKDTNMIN
ncbi:hypothetical protein LOZ65_006819 [Ophidiomyces ophidiicola]|nr:hypothetical protein LOZ65_006819 [Ophidiomyces ophidiicola]